MVCTPKASGFRGVIFLCKIMRKLRKLKNHEKWKIMVKKNRGWLQWLQFLKLKKLL